MTEALAVDATRLREEVQNKYRGVATAPGATYHFHTGRVAARRLRRGEVTVIDVRPAAEYEAGHVEGARSLPIDDLERRLKALPRDDELVAYCRGPYCVFADDAVRLFPEWKRAGLPVEVGAAAGGDGS